MPTIHTLDGRTTTTDATTVVGIKRHLEAQFGFVPVHTDLYDASNVDPLSDDATSENEVFCVMTPPTDRLEALRAEVFAALRAKHAADHAYIVVLDNVPFTQNHKCLSKRFRQLRDSLHARTGTVPWLKIHIPTEDEDRGHARVLGFVLLWTTCPDATRLLVNRLSGYGFDKQHCFRAWPMAERESLPALPALAYDDGQRKAFVRGVRTMQHSGMRQAMDRWKSDADANANANANANGKEVD